MKPLRINKPWGYELLIANNSDCGAKLLVVKNGCRLSLQQHVKRHETWYGISGVGWVTLESEAGTRGTLLTSGEVVHIPTKVWHRVEALTDLKLFEVVPKYDPDDIIRKEDDYGRT